MTEKSVSNLSMEDLAHGQVVLVTARWILVATALVLTFWNPAPIGALRVQIVVLLLLAFGNFYLNLELFRRRDILTWIVYGASAADLAVITLYVMLTGGFESSAFVFYFPALLALSVVFPGILTFLYAGGAICLYAMICAVSMFTLTDADLVMNNQTLIVRLLMLAAIVVCGNLYRRIETKRRTETGSTEEELRARVGKRGAQPA